MENEKISDARLIIPGAQHNSGANHLYESLTPLVWVKGIPVTSSII